MLRQWLSSRSSRLFFVDSCSTFEPEPLVTVPGLNFGRKLDRPKLKFTFYFSYISLRHLIVFEGPGQPSQLPGSGGARRGGRRRRQHRRGRGQQAQAAAGRRLSGCLAAARVYRSRRRPIGPQKGATGAPDRSIQKWIRNLYPIAVLRQSPSKLRTRTFGPCFGYSFCGIDPGFEPPKMAENRLGPMYSQIFRSRRINRFFLACYYLS
jgi:hypothetical protein